LATRIFKFFGTSVFDQNLAFGHSKLRITLLPKHLEEIPGHIAAYLKKKKKKNHKIKNYYSVASLKKKIVKK
jgi:hypothetical protein